MESNDVKADFRNAYRVFDNSKIAQAGLQEFIKKSGNKYAVDFGNSWNDIKECSSWEELDRKTLQFYIADPAVKNFVKDFQKTVNAYSGWVSRDGEFFRRNQQGQLYRFKTRLSDEDLLSLSPYANIERKKRTVEKYKDGEEIITEIPNTVDLIIDSRRGKILEMDFQQIINGQVCRPVNGRIKVINNKEAYTARFYLGFKDRTTQNYLYKMKNIKKNFNNTMNTIIQKHNQKYKPVAVNDIFNLQIKPGWANKAFEK